MENGGNYGRLLPGERFFPMDDELIVYYLKPLVNKKEVPGRGRLVFEYDLYQEPPSEIWNKFYVTRANDVKRSKSLYFFCRPEQLVTSKPSNGDKPGRISRRLKCGGTWKENNEKKVISPETNTEIGYKKTFSYQKTRREKSNWIMYEFKLDPSQLLDKNLVNDYVLCVLRKKDDVQEEDDNKEEEDQPQHKRPRLVPSIDNYATSTQPTSQYSSIIGNPNPQQVQQISFYGDHYGKQYASSGQVLQQQMPLYGDQNPYGIMHHLSGQVQNLSQPFLIPSTTITTNAPLISSDQIDAEMYQCSYPSWCVENLNADQPVAIHGSHAEISGEQGVIESYPYAYMQFEGSEKIYLPPMGMLGEIDVHTYVQEFGNNGEEILGQQTVISSCGGPAETEIGRDEERSLKEFVNELEDMLTSEEEIVVNSSDSNDVAEDNTVEDSNTGEEILGQQTVISSCGGHAETAIGGDEERALKEFVDELEDLLTSEEME